MGRWRVARRAMPYVGAMGVVLLSGLLVGTVFLTSNRLPWQAFLGGALVAATLALASRLSNSAWTIARRTAQLDAARTRLASETVMRNRAERALETVNAVVRYMDEWLPAMVAYVDRDYRVAFHNRAYAAWLDCGSMRLEGRALAELFGAAFAQAIRPHLEQAFAGRVVRYERVHTRRNGEPSRVCVHGLPHRDEAGGIAGVFVVLTDVTTREDLSAAACAPREAEGPAPCGDVAARIVGALEADEFVLYSQAIRALDPADPRRDFREVLLRLQEEEDNLVPPGEFLPIAERHGLMPAVDRWVVEHVVAWAVADPGRRAGLYSINMSPASLRDPAFVAGIRDRVAGLRESGPALCFELGERDAIANVEELTALIRELHPLGVRFAVSGFGRSRVCLELLKRLELDFVKIDGSLIVCMGRGPDEAARVRVLARAARDRGVRTVAECVEDEATLRALRAMGVDYAQGFAVARLRALAAPSAPARGIDAGREAA